MSSPGSAIHETICHKKTWINRYQSDTILALGDLKQAKQDAEKIERAIKRGGRGWSAKSRRIKDKIISLNRRIENNDEECELLKMSLAKYREVEAIMEEEEAWRDHTGMQQTYHRGQSTGSYGQPQFWDRNSAGCEYCDRARRSSGGNWYTGGFYEHGKN